MAPYTFLENIETDVRIPESGVRSKTVFDDEGLRVVVFGFASGHEMPVHSAPMPIVLYLVRGEVEVTAGAERISARAGAFIHMEPQVPHGILAKTPVTMVLMMLKQVRREIEPEKQQ